MKRIIYVVVIAVIMLIGLTGCTDAETVSYNLSKEADSFKLNRLKQENLEKYRFINNLLKVI